MQYVCEENWPKLAWCAICSPGSNDVRVYHGSAVEARTNWFGEVVWDGEFSAGEFDLTDIVAGSGGRNRNGELVFVSSASLVDRLHTLQTDGHLFVSNSLPCLLAVADASLDPTYPDYYGDLRSINDGLSSYRRHIQSSKGAVELVYFDNLSWDGNSLSRKQKPHGQSEFPSYQSYYDYLTRSMRAIAANSLAQDRQFSFELLTTISTGYDSAAVAAVSASVGCKQAMTIAKSRAGDSDSGEEIGRYLGLDVHVAERDAWRGDTCAEVPFIAGGQGGGGSVFFKSAEQQLAGTVLFTGLGGGLVWDKPKILPDGGYGEIGFSDASLAEYRLAVGFIHCVMPLFGMRTPDDIFRLSKAEEMKPWRVPGSYSRPIPRRILESAGVPREAFGMVKRAAAFKLHQPFSAGESLSPSSADDFADWLRENRGSWLRKGRLPPTRATSALVDILLHASVLMLGVAKKLVPVARVRAALSKQQRRIGHYARRPPGSTRRYTFPWAVSRMRSQYIDTTTHALEKG